VSQPVLTVSPASKNIPKIMQLRCMVYQDLIFSATSSLTSSIPAISHEILRSERSRRHHDSKDSVMAKVVLVLCTLLTTPSFRPDVHWTFNCILSFLYIIPYHLEYPHCTILSTLSPHTNFTMSLRLLLLVYATIELAVDCNSSTSSSVMR
jgi:hypothetical protein